MPYAPSTQPLADLDDAPLVASELAGTDAKASPMALRGGRVRAVPSGGESADYFLGLPMPLQPADKAAAYVAPLAFTPYVAGERHRYDFVITPEFAEASRQFLSGNGAAAIAALDRILANTNQDQALLWQASTMRAETMLVLQGRIDLAETELLRTDALERKASGKNHVARSMRAQLRLWSGDMPGAARDAAQVVRAIGTWRFPTFYPTPASDGFEIARVITAQIRAQLVLGQVLAARGDFKAALPWFQLADQAMNDVAWTARYNPFYKLILRNPPETLVGRGNVLAAYAMSAQALNAADPRADDLFRKARDYFDAAGFRAGALLIQLYKCNALYQTDRFEQLAEAAQTGIDEATKLGANEQLWLFHAFRGTALLRLQRWDAAEQSLRSAQSLLDLITGTSPSRTTGLRAAIGAEAVTEGLVALDLCKQGGGAQLFEDLERGHARSFVALLANRSVAIGRQEELSGRIRRLDEDIAKERSRKTAIVTDAELRPQRERELLNERAQRIAELRRLDPELADALSVSSTSLDAVQAMLPDGFAMVYALPAGGKEPVRLMLITRATASVRTLALDADGLSRLLDEFNKAVAFERAGAQRDSMASLRQALGVDLWGRFNAAYVVPSGRLHFVPWGALDLPYPVAVLPNGAWLARSVRGVPAGGRAVVLGDPTFGGVLEQLPGARAEAISVSGAYASAPLIGAAATEQALRAQVGGGIDVLHLATHALYDPVFPLQSSLILTDGGRAVPLSAESLFQRPIAARLVVLSACETGMGRVIAGDDLLGLTRSFYLGGASAVVSSLWPVNDQATRIFMEVFHERVRRGSYGVAWVAARDAVRQRGYPPSAYGAFVLGGSLGATP